MCSPELSPVLAKLYNKCLSESSLPSCWKISPVVPAYKNDGERSDPGNYRLISLLPIRSKIFESFVNNRISKHLEGTGLFSDLQHGIRAFRSTADILTVLSERNYNSLDVGGETRVIALHISKVFDKVLHAGLLHKLKAHGVRGYIPSLNLFFKIGSWSLFLMVCLLHHMISMQQYCRDRFWDPHCFLCTLMTCLMVPFQELEFIQIWLLW